MKYILRLLTLVLFTSIIVSCSSDDDGSSQTLSAEIVGDWSGSFSGGDSGTWNITVSQSGTVTGSGFSTTFQENYTFEGNVDFDGQLNATVGTSSTGAIFTGLLSTDGTGVGTWTNTDEGLNGSWEGNKQ